MKIGQYLSDLKSALGTELDDSFGIGDQLLRGYRGPKNLRVYTRPIWDTYREPTLMFDPTVSSVLKYSSPNSQDLDDYEEKSQPNSRQPQNTLHRLCHQALYSIPDFFMDLISLPSLLYCTFRYKKPDISLLYLPLNTEVLESIDEEEIGELVDLVFDENDLESDQESDEEPKNPWENSENWWKG